MFTWAWVATSVHGRCGHAVVPQSIRYHEALFRRVRLYVLRQAISPWRYVLEQFVQVLAGGLPSIVGIAIRAVAYRLIIRMDGPAAIERRVRICFASQVRLGRDVYLDEGVYLHATPGGVAIGDGTCVMHRAELHVFNFRDLPRAGIRIGRGCFVGEFNVLRGQGGITIGDNVYLSPMVQLMAVDHVFADPRRPIREQGITARGITIEDDVWIGAGAVVLDGVRVGRGAVIGAGAVVTRDVEPHTVVAGVPAVVRRQTTGASGRPEAEVFHGGV